MHQQQTVSIRRRSWWFRRVCPLLANAVCVLVAEVVKSMHSEILVSLHDQLVYKWREVIQQSLSILEDQLMQKERFEVVPIDKSLNIQNVRFVLKAFNYTLIIHAKSSWFLYYQFQRRPQWQCCNTLWLKCRWPLAQCTGVRALLLPQMAPVTFWSSFSSAHPLPPTETGVHKSSSNEQWERTTLICQKQPPLDDCSTGTSSN